MVILHSDREGERESLSLKNYMQNILQGREQKTKSKSGNGNNDQLL